MEKKKTDLRVKRTKQSIRKAFCDMIIEMDYHEITIKELAHRAMINRNTFYLHYTSVDELLEELQNEIAEKLISMYISYENIKDVEEMIRRFFEYVTSGSSLQERIFCSGSYRFVAEKINEQIVAHRNESRRGALGVGEATEDMLLAYCGSVASVLFRQWVAGGKRLSVDELIELATNLICHGMDAVIGQKPTA